MELGYVYKRLCTELYPSQKNSHRWLISQWNGLGPHNLLDKDFVIRINPPMVAIRDGK